MRRVARFRRLGDLTVFMAVALALSACASVGDIFGSSSRSTTPRPPPAAEGTPLVATQTVSNSAIPVLVNDQPITRYDIDQRARLMRLGGAGGGKKAATEELINEKVQTIEAARFRVVIPDGQIDQAYASIAKSLNLSVAQFNKALRSEGVNPKSLKSRLRAQIAWGELVKARTRAEKRLSSEELTTALLEKGDPTDITMTEFFLQQIIFVVPSGSSTARYTQRRNEANAFRQRYGGCEGALAQARLLTAVVVKDIGRRSSDQLAGPQGEDIRATATGKTGKPNKTDQGIELIAVCSKREIQSSAEIRAEIENKYTIAQAENLGADYLKELREAAIIEYR
ncbi:MAG: hypothetical protein ACTSYE_00030 [Alphaproteobacteria bacterium]